MIIYSGSKADFMVQVEEDTIAYTIRDNILEKMHRKTPDAEFRSWVNSLENTTCPTPPSAWTFLFRATTLNARPMW